MATTGTGPGSTGKGTKDWNTSAGQSGTGARDRRPAGDQSATTSTTGGTGSGATESATETASGIAQSLRDTTYRSIDDQKVRASDTLGSLAGAVRGMTQPLRDGGQPQIADYVNKAADGIERWASNMRQQDLEDAVRAVEQFARRQPAMFLGIAFGAGLAAARFLKSSNDARDRRAYGEFDYGSSNRTPSYGASGTRSGSLGTGTTSVGSTGLGGTDFGGTAGAGGRGTTSGDIPRVSDRTTGEVL